MVKTEWDLLEPSFIPVAATALLEAPIYRYDRG